jgi:cytochrome c oxidase assembly protein subunit 11
MSNDIGQNKYIVAKLFLAAIAMFGFGFVLVPIYDVLCDITGLNGKTKNESYQAVEQIVDTTRWVEVQFLTNNNDGMVWEFKPNVKKIKVNPGAQIDVSFYAKNVSNRYIVAQAIPSVSPNKAAEFFHKTECFCFEQQALEGNDSIDMPLRFIVDTALPKDVKTITLSYTLFDVTSKLENEEKQKVLEITNAKFKNKELNIKAIE